MARIRTIKPQLFKNETLADLSATCRLLYIGLFCLADKEGRLEDRPKRIKAEIFPYAELDVDEMLNQLQDSGFIERYQVGEIKVVQVINFTKHQRIQGKESHTQSEFPEKEAPGKQPGNTGETTENNPGSDGETLGNTGKERNKEGKEEGKGTDSDDEKFIVPMMLELWKKNFPKYTSDQKSDYPALTSIMNFMLDQAGGRDPSNKATQELILGTLQAVADKVKADNFWAVKPLKAISNNIQEFYNKIKTPDSGKNKTGITIDGLKDAIGRKLAEQGIG